MRNEYGCACVNTTASEIALPIGSARYLVLPEMIVKVSDDHCGIPPCLTNRCQHSLDIPMIQTKAGFSTNLVYARA